MMETSESIDEISAALAKAQASIRNAVKGAVNPHFKSSYADLASIRDACQAALSENGIAVVQAPESGEDGAVTMVTTLAHSSGQWFRSTLSCVPVKPDAQGIGSVTTYLRRYSLAAMTGVAPDDDDGEGAVGRGKGKGDEMKVGKPARARRAAKPGGNGSDAVAILIEVPAEPGAIPVPMPPDGREQGDVWREWVKAFVRAINAAPDAQVVGQWIAANDPGLDGLEKFHPETRAYVTKKTEERLDALADEGGTGEAGKETTPLDAG